MSRVFVAGHRGMVGSAIVRALEAGGESDVVVVDRADLDLLDQAKVAAWFRRERIDVVYLAAAKVGGIAANAASPADFIGDNLVIETNVIRGAFSAGIERLLFLGSSCIYPKYAPQPIREEALLTGELEPSNEPYAIAKIAGIKLAESYNRQHGTDYRSIMPTNLYGPGDNFHPSNSHVLPGLIRRFELAKAAGDATVPVWGSGTPRREFLHVDDMAAASLHVMRTAKEELDAVTTPTNSHLNAGTGEDITIRELAELVAEAVGFEGAITFDSTRPDGTPRKLLDSSRLHALGWNPRIRLDEGIAATVDWYREHAGVVRSK